MNKFLLTLIVISSSYAFAQNPDSLNNHSELDSIKYSESDFLQMKQFFKNNTETEEVFAKQMKEAGKKEILFHEIEAISYANAIKKYGEMEVKYMIHSFKTSMNHLRMFKEIDSANDNKIDEILKSVDSLNQRSVELQLYIDSLKNTTNKIKEQQE